MIDVRRLGHATLTTPDLDRQVAYYTEIVGLTLLERDLGHAEALLLEAGALSTRLAVEPTAMMRPAAPSSAGASVPWRP